MTGVVEVMVVRGHGLIYTLKVRAGLLLDGSSLGSPYGESWCVKG